MYTNQIGYYDELPYTPSYFDGTAFHECMRWKEHYKYEQFVHDNQCSHVIKYYHMMAGECL